MPHAHETKGGETNMESWKRVFIDDQETLYEISNYGRCRRIDKLDWKTRGILKPKVNRKTGYVQYCLVQNKQNNYRYAHRLVAEYFVEGDTNLDVNHIDGNKQNNNHTNLEWVTKEENMKHAFENGLSTVNKPVKQYDLKGNYLTSFTSASEAARKIGIDERSISSSLRGNYTNTAGYQWRFKEDNSEVVDISATAKRHNVGVVQLSMNGEFIAEFKEIHMAYVSIGKTDNGVISQVCRGKRNSHAGFRWMYRHDYYKNVGNDIVYTHSS